jgi:hypothetical protein
MPDYSHLRAIGCAAYVHIPKELRVRSDKMGARAESGILVGYGHPHGTKGYRVLLPCGKTRTCCDVTFNESVKPSKYDDKLELEMILDKAPTPPSGGNGTGGGSVLPAASDPPRSERGEPEALPQVVEDSTVTMDNNPELRRSDRLRTPSTKITGEYVAYMTKSDVPKTIEEALYGPDKDIWSSAALDELASLQAYRTWELLPKPDHARPLPLMWVFTEKFNSHGERERCKGRLVVKGFMQRAGIDFNETFAPIAKYPSVRALLAKAAYDDWDLHHWKSRLPS